MNYDFLIAGGGCAGLSLLNTLLDSPLKHSTIAVFDQEDKTENDRTWCYWSASNEKKSYPTAASWRTIEITSKGKQSFRKSLDGYEYNCVFSKDFYEYVHDKAKDFDNIYFIKTTVQSVESTTEGAKVHTDSGVFKGKKAFTSLRSNQTLPYRFFLWQNFSGWFIKTNQSIFKCNAVRLMDFNTPAEKNTQFFYVLPFTENFALVELTKFENQPSDFSSFQQPIAEYIQRNWGLSSDEFEIVRKEQGRIPMTDADFSVNVERNVFPIGTEGGNTKSTTGYTFKNIHEESQRIVKLLVENQPLTFHKKPQRFTFYDKLLLHILKHHPEKGAGIFTRLFKKNHPTEVFDFLDEKTSLWSEAKLVSTLPWPPFLKALLKEYIISPSPKKLRKLKKRIATPSS